MEFLKRFFSFLWALWGAFWFMVTVAIFTLISVLIFAVSGKKYVNQLIWINVHYLCPFLLAVWGIRLKIFGAEKINPKGTYVFVSNHLTGVDIIATGASLPQPVKFLAKSEIKYIPFFGTMTKMLAIMVERKNKASRDKSVQYMIEELRKGNSLFIYPEGTRNRTAQPLKDFKDGAFRLAIMAQVPVAVQTQVGTKKVNNPEGLQLLPGTVEIYWSDPIETKGMTLGDVPALEQKVKDEMLKYLGAA